MDYEQAMNVISFYALDGRQSYTDNYQIDFSVDPVERFNITATIRYTNAKMICITGSNGKTTTTSLIYYIFKKAGLNVGLAGNIGKSLAYQVA